MDALRRPPLRAALLGIVVALAAPAAATAAIVEADGNPLNIYANGQSAIQARFDGQDAGVFYSPGSNAAHAGLEIVEVGGSYYSTGSGTPVSGPVLQQSGSRRTLHSVYRMGPNLEVTEDVSYTDGERQMVLRYAVRNISAAPVSFRAGELSDLYVGGSDSGTGVFRAG